VKKLKLEILRNELLRR